MHRVTHLLVRLVSVERTQGMNTGFVNAFDAQKGEDNHDELQLCKGWPSERQGDDFIMPR